jgi:hypothetical protein
MAKTLPLLESRRKGVFIVKSTVTRSFSEEPFYLTPLDSLNSSDSRCIGIDRPRFAMGHWDLCVRAWRPVLMEGRRMTCTKSPAENNRNSVKWQREKRSGIKIVRRKSA